MGKYDNVESIDIYIYPGDFFELTMSHGHKHKFFECLTCIIAPLLKKFHDKEKTSNISFLSCALS